MDASTHEKGSGSTELKLLRFLTTVCDRYTDTVIDFNTDIYIALKEKTDAEFKQYMAERLKHMENEASIFNDRVNFYRNVIFPREFDKCNFK